MKTSLISLIAFVVFSVSCSRPAANQVENTANGPTSSSSASPETGGEKYSVIFTIPVGEGGVNYANVGEEELEPLGPSAFTIGPDGTYFIADAVNNKILRFRPDSSQMPSIPVEGVVGITDITVSNDNIYVLDQAALTPAIIRLTMDGKMQEKTLLSPQPGGGLRSRMNLRSLSGLATADDGAVLLEFEAGAATRRLDDRRALDRSMRGKNYSVKVPTLQNQVLEGGRGYVLLNGQPFAEIRVDNFVAEMRKVSVNAAGDLFVLVDEIAATPQVNVDETVRRYSADGTPTGIARVPIRELRSYNMPTTVRPDENGEVVAFDNSKGKQTAAILRLSFETQLEPILPKFSPNQISVAPAAPCRTRQQMTAMADKYVNNKVMLNLTNLDGVCEGRRKPRYLAGPGEYSSVAYDWAGFDTVEDYNRLMGENSVAGDITSEGEASCSRGVDCSGFVLRCWGFKKRDDFSTATLPNISTEISILQLLPGDILNLPHAHVILFHKFDNNAARGNGIMAWEATGTGPDRVVDQSTSWRRRLGYTARRYKQVC